MMTMENEREREKAHSRAIFNTAAADAANFVRENGGWRGRSLRHPFLNGAHAARNKRKLRDHRPPGQKKSFLRSPTSAIHGPRANERRSRLYNGTARNQSISIAAPERERERERQEEANAVGRRSVPIPDCCSNATRRKQDARVSVAAGGEF